LQNGGGISAGIYVSMDKPVDQVHASVDRPGALDPPWTDGSADRGGARGCGTLAKARPPAAPVHQSSQAGVQKGERSMGSSARASPELGRRCSDRATAVAQRGHGKLSGEGFWRGRGEEKGAVRCGVLRGSSGGFYRAGGGHRGGGRSNSGGEW
jgi:hypothetical protein